MINIKHIMLLGFGLLISSSLMAQTVVTYTADSTMSDAMVANGGVETMNFGSQNEFRVYHQVGQQIPMVFRSFIQYDLSAIPAGAIITEAKLKLNAKSVNNNISHPIYIERVENTSWSESTVTWNNQPGVISADQLSFTHAQTSSTGVQEFDVTDHVQHMVTNPGLNNGWRIRLQSEQSTSDYGIIYNSSEASTTANRPVLQITYVMPIEMSTTVSHCTAGNDDGTFSVDVSGGSTYGISNMYLYKTNRNLAQRGTATVSNYKTIGNLQYNSGTGEVTAENLEPGIYILRILDAQYSTNSDPRLAFYQHILVGRDGETTSGILLPNFQYQENTSIQYDKPANTNPLDRANTNYHSNSSSIPLRAADAPNNYEFASLIKYKIDFDDQLEFSKAELQMKAWGKFFRHNNSSNAVQFSRITSDWEESQVTWNTRPSIDSLAAITLPATIPIGYDSYHKWDTVDLVSFVEYWQEHPEENYGFEIALETYGASQYAQRSYKSTGNNLNYIEFEFTVKSPVTTTFDDATNRGTLSVDAPNGTLPYTYLINTEPLGTLTDIWNGITDSLTLSFIDSTDFFTGDISATTHSFTELPSGKYYVGVYDNNGTKILDGSGVVNTAIAIYDDTDLELSSSNIITRSSAAQGDGKGRLYAELLANDSWGGVTFKVETLGSFCAGFNKTSDAVASSGTDFEFGISVDAQGAYQIIENNVLLSSAGSVTAGQEISIIREHEEYIISIDGTETHSGTITNLTGEDISVDLILTAATGQIKSELYWGYFRRPAPAISVIYPECGAFNGTVNINAGVGGTIASVTLENNDGVSPSPIGGCAVDGSSCVFPTVPIGTYTLTVTYSVDPMGDEPGYSYTTEEQVAIGYVVEWEEFVNTYVADGSVNTIQRYPFIVVDGDPVGTAKSANVTLSDYPNWLQFETGYTTYGFDFGSIGAEGIALQNQDGEQAYSFITGLWDSPPYITFRVDDGYDWSSFATSRYGVWRIEQDGEEFSFFKNNISLSTETIEVDDAPSPYGIKVYQQKGATYVKTIASFCNNYPLEQYVEPKREIEGGYYVVPNDHILRFEFTEEYTLDDFGGNLKYTILDFAGVPQEGGLDDLSEAYGDNRFLLDVSSLSSGFYVMEIINDKGENWFLRFKK